jgi:hypothetical protein
LNQAREAFHAHLAAQKKVQQQPDYTDEELLMEERDLDQEFNGQYTFYLQNFQNYFL